MSGNFGHSGGGSANPASWAGHSIISAPINMGDGDMEVGDIKTGDIDTF